MTKRSTISHKDVSHELLSSEDVRTGYNKRSQIIQIGKSLRKVREEQVKLTQSDAAALINIKQSELSRIETGTGAQGLSWSTFAQIIEAYKTYLHASGTEVSLTLNISAPGGYNKRYALDSEKEQEEIVAEMS